MKDYKPLFWFVSFYYADISRIVDVEYFLYNNERIYHVKFHGYWSQKPSISPNI